MRSSAIKPPSEGSGGALTAHAVSPTVLLAVEREAIRDLLLPNEAE